MSSIKVTTFIKNTLCYTLEEKVATNQGELPQYYIEGHHEAIINPEEWEAVQAIIKERATAFETRNHKKYSKNNNKNEAFIDKLQCGECGNGFSHQRTVERRGDDEGYEVHRWVCRLALTSSKCGISGRSK